MNLCSPKELKFILEKHGFSFTKSLGQNFLIDQNTVEKIVEGSGVKGENILEIGPGVGTMTQELAKTAKKVVAVEIDYNLKPLLAETLDGLENVEVVFSDILKVDINQLAKEMFADEEFKVVANLPYYITTPILVHLLKSQTKISDLIVMMQREVAERIVAEKGNKEYGSISVFLKYFGDSEILMNVPNTVFMPKPKVGSSVIRLKINPERPEVKLEDLEIVLRACFQMRRKIILNSLSSGLKIDKQEVKQVLEELELSENLRAENLTLDDYLKLAEKLTR